VDTILATPVYQSKTVITGRLRFVPFWPLPCPISGPNSVTRMLNLPPARWPNGDHLRLWGRARRRLLDVDSGAVLTCSGTGTGGCRARGKST
jgi:hypothetical protein